MMTSLFEANCRLLWGLSCPVGSDIAASTGLEAKPGSTNAQRQNLQALGFRGGQAYPARL